VQQAPNAGADGTLTTCSDGPTVDLFSLLGPSPDPGGAWTFGGLPASSSFIPGTSTPGTYTYTVNGTPPCTNASANVVVTVVQAPNAGLSRSITVCSDETSFALIGQLGGTPDAGGTWSGGSDTFDPGAHPGGTYPYTYTVPGTSPCADATATLTITVRVAPYAGLDRTAVFCSNDPTVNLFNLLGGTPDAGGTWTGPGGAHSDQFQPSVDVSGDYIYQVTGQAPCSPAIATVSITVNPAPNAGTSASIVRCSNEAAFTLISQLGGTPDNGGTWTGPGGAPFPGGVFTPGSTAPGLYTYQVTALSPCAPAVATVNVAIVTAPNAGAAGTYSVCSSDGTFSLFDHLTGTPDVGGTWTGPSGPVPSGMFNPGSSVPGAYTYLVVGSSPCANATATVTITVVQAGNAGSNGSVTLCSTSADDNLFTHLGGTPGAGGVWTKPGGGVLPGGIYQPANPADPAGVYTYTVTGTTPCPNVASTVQVVEHQAPRAGTDGSTIVCSTGSPFGLSTVLGGTVDGGGAWINAGGSTSSSTFTPGTSVPGPYRYVVPGIAPCPNDTSLVTVNVTTAPVAGTNGSAVVCSDAGPLNLFLLLGGTPDSGGTWADPNNAVNNGIYVPGPGAVPGAYTYTVHGLSPCANASATVTVTQNRRPRAGTNGTLQLCSTAPATDLFGSLGGIPDAGGTWTGPGGAPSSGIFIPAVGGTFVYMYRVTGTAPCAPDSATVTVTVTQAPNAGGSGELTICSGQATVDLFTGIVGAYDFNGTWHDDDGTGRLSTNFFNPGTPTQLPPGHYSFTYVVPANGLCTADSATVGVTIVAQLDAGSNGTITVCSSQTQVNLFTGLSGTPQPGGTWIDLDNTGLVTGQYFNANGVSGAGPYHFRYRLTGALGCSSDSAVASVTVVAAPNAGVDATATFCSTGSPVSLLPYLGPSAQINGTWRKPPPGNQVFSGTYDPPTFTPGNYTYTLNGTPPCANAVGTVHVVETPGPEAGSPAVTTVCSSDAAFNMTQLLGTPDINGTWKDPSNAVHSNIFVPGLDPPGVYLYTVSGVFPCGNVTVSLTVNVFPAAYAGPDVTTTVCDNSTSFLLFSLLESSGAQSTGTWFDPSMAHFPSANYVPGTSQPGTYTYTVSGGTASPCGADTATVTVFETTSPNAGTSTSATFCSNGPAVALVSLLTGADPTGTWVGPAPTNPYFSGTFQPGANAPGVYTYRVQGLPPCANDSSTVTVSVAPALNAGTSRSITVCQSQLNFVMVDSLGGDPSTINGSWTELPGGGYSNGLFMPSIPGTYSFLYTVTGAGATPCSPAQATLSITVNAAPDAGTHGTLTLCSTSGVTSLFPSLGGTPQSGGTWTFQGVAHGGNFNPAIDVSGDYVYTVNGVAPCPSASANVTVTLNHAPNAGSNGVLTICDNDLTPIVLGDVLGGTEHDHVIDGWTLDGNHVSDIYLPSNYPAGVHTFTYTVPGLAPCVASTAQVTIIQNAAPNAGNSASQAVCSSDPSVDLFGLLGSADGTGNWIDANGVAASPTFLPSAHAPGVWVYHYIVHGNAPCLNDSSTVSITVNRKPQAGVSTAPQICTNSGSISLLGLLGTPLDSNGTWVFHPVAGPNVPHGPVFNPLVDGPGAYIYTVTGIAPCSNATATAQITLVPAPNAGTSGTISVCASEAAVHLFPVLGGTPATGGNWSDNDATGQLNNGIFNAAAAGPGLYHFTYTVAGVGPCASASSIVSVTVTDALDAGIDNAISLCSSETNVDLFSYLGGSPQPGGIWTGVESSAGLTNGVLNAGIAGVGLHHYRYVLAGSSNCTPDTSVIATTIQNGPIAGNDGFISTCSNASPVDLFTLLGGSHDSNGTWYYPNGGEALASSIIVPSNDPPGAYLYVVPAIGSCPADSATVTVTIPLAPNAGTNGALAFCSNGSPQGLMEGLGGAPDSTGSWFQGSPLVAHSGIYDPAVDNPGQYLYRVNGVSPCANAEATVFVSEIAAPYAGQDNSYTTCSDVGSFNMFPHLAGGNPQGGGFWYSLGPPVTPHASTYNPLVDSSGVFLYVVHGSLPCAYDTARLTIVEVRAPQAGTSETIVACPTDDAVDVFAALGPDADTTGTWTGPNVGLLNGNIFDATQVPNGTYPFTYVVIAQSPCGNDSATITVNVGAGQNAGVGGNDSICGSLTDYDLFNSLSGAPDPGGVWSEQTGSGAINDHYLDATSLVPGATYTMVYTLVDPTCGDISSVVNLFIAPFPSPGGDSSIVLCTTSPSVPLVELLTGHPQSGGTWTGPSGGATDDVLDPAVDGTGTYTYHLIGTQFCSDTSAQVNVVVNQPAYAGMDSSTLVCNSGSVALFPLLAEGPQSGGTWSDISGSGALTADTVDVGVLTPGTYVFNYQVDVEGCPSDTATVDLHVVDGVSVEDVERICNEQYRTYVVRFTVTGGDPAAYVVSGGEGSLTTSAPYVFTSTPIYTSQSFQFSVDDENHCTPQTVEGETPCDFDEPVMVPESFTPNGDGINDHLIIPGIEGFPGNSIVIYNRWGGEVYKASGYDNVHVFWDGSSPNALLAGDATTGTYYYVLDLGNGGDAVKGFIYLNR